MSHLSEGLLHAYLDGALDELPGGEAEKVRDHIDGCGDCAARLAEARAIREEAISILGGALPPIEVPPLEDLRARARTGARVPRRGAVRLARLGWAASIVLAVGAGWMLRGQQPPPIGAVDPLDIPIEPARRVLPEAQARMEMSPVPEEGLLDEVLSAGSGEVTASAEIPSEAPEADPVEDAGLERSALEGPLEAATITAAADAAGQPAVEETMTDLPPRRGLRELVAQGGVSIDAGVAAGADSAPPTADSVVFAERSRSPRVEPGSVPPSSPAELVSIQGATEQARARRSEPEADPRVVQSARRTAPAPLLPIERSAEKDGRGGDAASSGSLVVPGLEVVSITSLSDGKVSAGVRVLQLLPDGETLELIHLPEGVDPGSLEPFPDDGKTGVIAPRDGGFLILRAMRSVEELKAILDRLDGIS